MLNKSSTSYQKKCRKIPADVWSNTHLILRQSVQWWNTQNTEVKMEYTNTSQFQFIWKQKKMAQWKLNLSKQGS